MFKYAYEMSFSLCKNNKEKIQKINMFSRVVAAGSSFLEPPGTCFIAYIESVFCAFRPANICHGKVP